MVGSLRANKMGYEELRDKLSTFKKIIDQMQLSIEGGSLLKAQFDLIREFLRDRAILSKTKLDKKYDNDQFKEFIDALIVVEKLTDSVVALKDQPQHALRKRLKLVFAGQLTQDFSESQQAKDFFYEIEMAAFFRKAGFLVELREPDIVISGCDLRESYGIACKYPSSEKQVHNHLSKGYKQISRQKLHGLVSIGIDQIAFKGMGNYIDFRKIEIPPLDIIQQITDEAMFNLVAQRSKDYPSEPPIDGAIITSAITGILGDPAFLITVGTATMQCDSQNPMIDDIELIVSELNKKWKSG